MRLHTSDHGLRMQGVNLNLQAKNGVIKTKQTVKQFYQGSYSGQTTINARNKTPLLTVNEKISNVQIEPLLKDLRGSARMTGTANASAALQGRGNSVAALKSSLNGNIDLMFKEGYVKGFNLQKILDQAKSLLKGQSLPAGNENEISEFTEISATAKISNGLVRNKDLLVKSSSLRVNGEGNANLVTEALDYRVKAKLIKREATETEPEKIKGIPIAINIGGTFSRPSYRVDITSIVVEKNKAKIEEKKQELIEKLDKELGPGAGDLLKKLF